MRNPFPPSRGKTGMGVKRASRQVSARSPPPLVSGFRRKGGVMHRTGSPRLPRTPIGGSPLGEGEFCFTATDPTCYTMLHRNTLLKRVSDKRARPSFDMLRTNGSFRFPQLYMCPTSVPAHPSTCSGRTDRSVFHKLYMCPTSVPAHPSTCSGRTDRSVFHKLYMCPTSVPAHPSTCSGRTDRSVFHKLYICPTSVPAHLSTSSRRTDRHIHHKLYMCPTSVPAHPSTCSERTDRHIHHERCHHALVCRPFAPDTPYW